MRVLGLLPLAAVAATLAAPAQAETAHTMRIETRPVYGATAYASIAPCLRPST
jgi:hypothetical protein